MSLLSPYGRLQYRQYENAGSVDMAGVAAGVKGMADVNMQPRQGGKLARNLSSPAVWTYIWVGGAFAYLVMTYFGIARISRMGS